MAKNKVIETNPMEYKPKPSISLSDSDVIPDLKIGDEVTLTIKAKLVSHGSEEYGPKKSQSQRFDVVDIKRDGDMMDSDNKIVKALKMSRVGKGMTK